MFDFSEYFKRGEAVRNMIMNKVAVIKVWSKLGRE